MRWYGFKTNDGAITLAHEVELQGEFDLRRRANEQAAGKPAGIDSQYYIQNGHLLVE